MAKIRRELVAHTFKGDRFDDHGIDLDVLPDLLAYKTLLVETAKELWRRRNPDRQRLPKNFEDSLALKFYEVRDGSATIPLIREIETEDQQMPFWESHDELDEAVDLIADTVDAASQDGPLPEAFPSNIIPLFESYGKTLRQDESIEHRVPTRAAASRYTTTARERLIRWIEVAYEDAVDIIGTVTMARVSRPRMGITIDGAREIEAVFKPEDEEIITTALKDHATAKVRVQGRGQFSAAGQIQKIIQIDRVILLPSGEIPFDSTAKPIWEVFAEIIRNVPDEELRKLPPDTAENHDHYIYGTPKKKP